MTTIRMWGFDEWGLLPSSDVPDALLQADGFTGNIETVSRVGGRFGIGYGMQVRIDFLRSIVMPIGVRSEDGGGNWSFAFQLPSPVDLNQHIALYDSVTGNHVIQFTMLQYARVGLKLNGVQKIITIPGSVVTGHWHFLEIKWTAGVPGSDTCDFYIDGELLAAYTTVSIPDSFDSIRVFNSGGGEYNHVWLDDMILQNNLGIAPNNDLLGNIRVGCQYADAPGDLSEFTPVGVAENWEAALNIEIDPGIYVETDVVGDTDLYNLIANVPARELYGVQVKGVYMQTDATQLYGANVIKTGGTEFPGVSRGLSSGRRSQWDNWELNPDTGLAWTNAELAVVQIGPTLVSSD